VSKNSAAGPHDSDTVDLASMELEALRAARRAAEKEEQELSYVRRLLHGRIDILKAEASRRKGEGQDIIADLPNILADEPRGASRNSSIGGRFVAIDNPSNPNPATVEAQSALTESTGVDIADASDTEIDEILTALRAHERTVSDARFAIHRHIDDLSAELTSRYRDGTAQVDDLLAAARRN